MDQTSAGYRLKQKRLRLDLTTREVSEASKKIAEEEGNSDFMISHARLVQIENGDSTPSIHKLFSLSAIYGSRMSEMLSLYFETSRAGKHHLSSSLRSTHLLDLETTDEPVAFPKQFKASLDPAKTNLLSRMIEVWGEVPASLLRQLDVRKTLWGVIGLGDLTMYPLLRPGSLVQIDTAVKRPTGELRPRSEYDRPLYFVELRDAYICCWCELHKDRLFCVPHPLSPVGIREFAYPREAELVGQVTATASRIVNAAIKPEAARVASAVPA